MPTHPPAPELRHCELQSAAAPHCKAADVLTKRCQLHRAAQLAVAVAGVGQQLRGAQHERLRGRRGAGEAGSALVSARVWIFVVCGSLVKQLPQQQALGRCIGRGDGWVVDYGK